MKKFVVVYHLLTMLFKCVKRPISSSHPNGQLSQSTSSSQPDDHSDILYQTLTLTANFYALYQVLTLTAKAYTEVLLKSESTPNVHSDSLYWVLTLMANS